MLDPKSQLDDAAWDEAARFWQEEVAGLEADAGQTGEWRSWEPTTWGDGTTPIPREYRSICERRSYQLDRAFQILQHPTVNDDAADIAAWVKDFENDDLWVEDEWLRLPRRLLVITLAVTNETAVLARTLLRHWMRPATTPPDMQSFIDGRITGKATRTEPRSGNV